MSKKSAGDPRRHVPVFRGSFVHLVKAHRIDEDADARYSMVVMLDPDNDEHMDFLDDLEEWIEEVSLEKFGGKSLPKKFTSPIKEVNDEFEDPGEFKDFLCFNAYKNQDRGRPGIVGPDGEPMDEMDYGEELYSGAWYRATIRPWAWDHKTGGKGASIALVNVMKVEDDEVLGSSDPDPEDDFADAKSAGRSKSRRKGRR